MQSSPATPAVDRFLDFVYQPIKEPDGTVVGIFVQGADVTARALAEAALRAKEAQLEEANRTLEKVVAERTSQLISREALLNTMYEHSTECHAVLREMADGGFCYEEVNPATLRLYGKSRAAVIGRTTDQVFGARDGDQRPPARHAGRRWSLPLRAHAGRCHRRGGGCGGRRRGRRGAAGGRHRP